LSEAKQSFIFSWFYCMLSEVHQRFLQSCRQRKRFCKVAESVVVAELYCNLLYSAPLRSKQYSTILYFQVAIMLVFFISIYLPESRWHMLLV